MFKLLTLDGFVAKVPTQCILAQHFDLDTVLSPYDQAVILHKYKGFITDDVVKSLNHVGIYPDFNQPAWTYLMVKHNKHILQLRSVLPQPISVYYGSFTYLAPWPNV